MEQRMDRWRKFYWSYRDYNNSVLTAANVQFHHLSPTPSRYPQLPQSLTFFGATERAKL